MERTEEEIINQAVIQVTLGGEKYDIKPLVISASREWKKKVVAMITPLLSETAVTSDDMDAFGKAVTDLMTTIPDQVLDLFFEYAKDLDRKKIESVATDAEADAAFQAVIAVAFPLSQSAPDVVTRLFQTPKTTKKGSR